MTPEMKNASPDGSVFSMIREHYDEMTLAQKRLADYILKIRTRPCRLLSAS